MEAALSRALQAQSLSSVNLGALRQPATIPYDTSVFQFRESVADALGLDSHEHLIGLGGAGVDESEHAPALPERYVGQKEKTVGGIKRGAWRGPATPWIQKWKAAKHKAPRTRFDALYVALLKEVILPHIGDPQGICFQREPTFRCHVSGGGESTGAPHIDADYGHQPSEINFWVPMTPVWGSNSLYSESAPGQGDFEAFELEYGEIKRFWGNQVRHYTVPNSSGSTRVSLDFRVVPRSAFLPAERYPNGTRRDGSARFQVGEFYLEMDAEGRVWADAARQTPHVASRNLIA